MDKKLITEMRFMMERLESPRMTDTELRKRYKKLNEEDSLDWIRDEEPEEWERYMAKYINNLIRKKIKKESDVYPYEWHFLDKNGKLIFKYKGENGAVLFNREIGDHLMKTLKMGYMNSVTALRKWVKEHYGIDNGVFLLVDDTPPDTSEETLESLEERLKNVFPQIETFFDQDELVIKLKQLNDNDEIHSLKFYEAPYDVEGETYYGAYEHVDYYTNGILQWDIQDSHLIFTYDELVSLIESEINY
jgi:hypothetical protein